MNVNPPVPADLIDAIQTYSEFIVIGHKNPDSDALNSQLVLGNILGYLGKKYHLVSPGPFERHEIRDYNSSFNLTISSTILERKPLVIIVDCSTPDRIAPLDKQLSGLKTAVIDHHASGSHFGDIRYVVPRAFSVTFLVYQLMKALDVPLDFENAQMLLFGLATDTGFFRHINEGRPEVFEMVTDLAAAGASPKDIYQKMFSGRSFRSRQLLGMLLSRTEQLYNGKLLVTWETLEEHNMFGEKERDSDSLYGQLLSVENCEVVVYLRQEEENSCTVGFRAGAESSIDVGMIAAGLGGGGHKKASGTTLQMDLSKAKTTVSGILAFYLGT